ncbi:MAG: hypothetical protein QM627_10140 [Luteolibacter sp.]
MSRSFHRRFWVLLAAGWVSYAVWKDVPGTPPDRGLFQLVAGSFANPPLLISGKGTHESPWQLRTVATETKSDPKQAPVVISLGNDPEGIFQSSPPSPADLGVLFANLRRLGAENAASAAVLSWETPDAMSLAALDLTMSRFESVLTTSPLSRGSVPSQMPASYRRASLPLSGVQGNAENLPLVNRVPIPNVIFGGDNALSGFNVLESEPESSAPYLVARWEDRVVFSFPLLVVMQRHRLPVEGIVVKPGEAIWLSAEGPVVPIDEFGRLSAKVRPVEERQVIPAEALIDAREGIFPIPTPGPVILRDDQSAAEPSTQAFSRNLIPVISSIASDAGMSGQEMYRRLSANVELGLLGGVCAVLSLIAGAVGYRRGIGFFVIVGVACSAQWIAAGMANLWLPMWPVVAATAISFVLAGLISWLPVPRKKKAPEEPSVPVEAAPEEKASEKQQPEPKLQPKSFPEPPPPVAAAPVPAKKAAKKAPAKKAAGKKTSGKKSPRRKK